MNTHLFPASDFVFDNNGQVYIARWPCVLHSTAGFYIGRECFDLEMPDWPQPYSRESIYWETHQEAQAWLDAGNWPQP